MRERELELILSVLDGTAEDIEAALATIRSSDELSAEYQAQLEARSALTSLGKPLLTEVESARLRRDVWTTLREETAPATSSRIPWYYRWIPAAGVGLLVLVVGINVLDPGGQDAGDSPALQESAATLAGGGADTTIAATSGDDAGGEGADGAEAPASEDFSALRSTVEDLRAEILGLSDSGALGFSSEESSLEDLAECLEEAGVGELALLGLLPPAENGGPLRVSPLIAAVPPDAPLAAAVITLVDATTCEVVYQGD